MNSLAKRLITACVAIPAIILLIVLLPYKNYLAFSAAITIACFIGNVEMRRMIERTGCRVSKFAYLGALIPAVEYIDYEFIPSSSPLVVFYISIVIGLIFASLVFSSSEDNFKSVIQNASASILNVIYPGLFAGFMTKFGFLPDGRWMILFFFVLVFGSDSFAYFTGILFGKNNKGIIKVSPNKSIAGYIGGILIPALISMAAAFIFPSHFTYNPAAGFLIGFIVSVFAAIGDLIESAFKRSSGVKDSGVAIPGRGGMLDSIDSLIIAAPVYFLLMEFFLGA